MNRTLIGYCVSCVGLGILFSAIVYPLGYLESTAVFYTMTTVGAGLVVIGSFIRPTRNKEKHEE
ncbi:hypothetical protein [Cytobacillus dafuensis]|uniref:Uncharacterized protein n=1 Tax=Cytobacillus dafuensis TaxID=1742359 RepID=A0A5B8Z6D2_CYTDA|nr:hypothetical protein [Cytobacillus dafuensis]QED47179.1 hypothetical protein FSZ17_07930 [Cytobacillus dafuensis]